MHALVSRSRWVKMLLFIILCLGTNTGLSADGGQLKQRVPPDQIEKAKSLQNPDPVTEESIANGKALYERFAFCSACHGLDGTGKKMDVRSPLHASPSPTNFADGAWQAARSDGELFWILKHGSHGTDMASYLPLYLSEEEAWQLVSYIRALGKT